MERMDKHAADYFHEFSDDGSRGNYHRVCPLHECADITWQGIRERCPSLPRGWFELSRLSQEDRLEFTRDYWLATLPYLPHINEGLSNFFEKLDDIGVFVTQEQYDAPGDCCLVYSIQEDGGFFRGKPPGVEAAIGRIASLFDEVVIPEDFQAFLKIHDGFGKYTDTGITPSDKMVEQYRGFQKFLAQNEPLAIGEGDSVKAEALIPFYESFGLHCYQCFNAEWYPEQEMGNVYYSGIEKRLSDWTASGSWSEKMAFPTFLDWLVFYLEGID